MTDGPQALTQDQVKEAVKTQLGVFTQTMEQCGTNPYQLWRAALAGEQIRTVDVSPVIIFAEQVGGWWIRNKQREQEFIAMEDWKKLYAAWEAKHPKPSSAPG